jgi:hypothetical protein
VIFETANGFELQWFQKTDGITRVDRRLRYEWTQPEQLELPQAEARRKEGSTNVGQRQQL